MTDVSVNGDTSRPAWDIDLGMPAYHPHTGQPITTFAELAEAQELDRHVAVTAIRWPRRREVTVSTAHTVIDRNYGKGLPVLYETMIFGHTDHVLPGDTSEVADFQLRYHHRENAAQGHRAAVATLVKVLVWQRHTVVQHDYPTLIAAHEDRGRTR
jgi:hypothetical protein